MVNTYLLYIFAGVAVLLAGLGLWQRGKRLLLWLGAVSAGGAAIAANAGAFWPLVCLGLLSVWAAFMALPLLDLGWRARFGLVFTIGSLALFALWPSLASMSGGRIPCPAYIKENVDSRLVAGLDLRGGLRLVYTVDVAEAIKDKRDRYYEEMRTELAKLFGIHKGDEPPTEQTYEKLRKKVDLEAPRSAENVIQLKLKEGADPAKLDFRFLEAFRGDLDVVRSNDKRELTFTIKDSVESEIRQRAVQQAREIILRRVDEMGLREASVSTRDEDIIVEVPGENEESFSTIRDIISQTARLDFKLLDDDHDFFGTIQKTAAPESLPEGLVFQAENAPVGLDADGEVVRKTITYAYLPIKDGEKSKDTLQRFQEWVATLELPPDREVGYELVYRVVDQNTLKEEEDGFRTYLLKSRAEVTGDMIRDAAAQPSNDQGGMGGWHVALTFTEQGGNIFERITRANVQRRFAIILDDRVESAPVILGAIPGGHASITMGSNDPQKQLMDARKLELVLRSGALPAPISPSNEQRIGPSLGEDSIRLGAEGALGGGLIVLAFMFIYYRRAGLITNIAVLMNLFLQLAILASFGASMTLPGIAGLALTIGMGVDANVLINERIREELRLGKSPRAAVELGYSRALSAIIDGQLTTLISGVVLAQYGSGPIKGFAVTLIVGVTCSIFTGVVVSRVLFDLWVRGFGRRTTLDMG